MDPESSESALYDTSAHTRLLRPAGNLPRTPSTNFSDPIYFSEDDLQDASVDNYATPRNKRQYKRKWYEEEDTAESVDFDAVEKTNKRAKDSGIFMSSDNDGSEGNLDDGLDYSQLTDNISRRTLTAQFRAIQDVDPEDSGEIPTSIIEEKTSEQVEAEDWVRRHVADVIENELETVDLSGLGIYSLPYNLLRPLQDLIIPPKFDQTSFKDLRPEIKIFLSGNKMSELPEEIINLTNLHTLSVRGNKLSKLPYNIGFLKSLRCLNIAGNRLHYLPISLLPNLCQSEGRLDVFNFMPNPLFTPLHSKSGTRQLRGLTLEALGGTPEAFVEDCEAKLAKLPAGEDADDVRRALLLLSLHLVTWRRVRPAIPTTGGLSELKESLDQLAYTPTYVGCTHIAYLDMLGCPILDPGEESPASIHWAPNDNGDFALPFARNPFKYRPSRNQPVNYCAPSLFESCLRVAAREIDLAQLEDDLDQIPATPRLGIGSAKQIADAGWHRCMSCDSEHVLNRAEWIEYWHLPRKQRECSNDELFVPFLATACSWACAEARVREKQAEWELMGRLGISEGEKGFGVSFEQYLSCVE